MLILNFFFENLIFNFKPHKFNNKSIMIVNFGITFIYVFEYNN